MLSLFKKKANIYLFGKRFSFKKAFNLLRSVYYYRYSKSPFVRSFPVRLVVDAGNICQLKCPLCPTGTGRPTRTKHVMAFDSFKKIVDEAGGYLFEIDLYNWGEPFLNKDIFRMIAYAKENGIKVSLSSHLNLFKDEWARSVVQLELDQLTVSIDGASRESYAQYRVGGDFDVVIGNLKKLVAEKRKMKSRYPRITWQYLVMRHNEGEIDKARQVARDIGVDELELRPMRCDMGMELLLSDEEKIDSIANWLPRQEKYSRYNYRTKKKKAPLSKCLFQTTTMVINANGSVSPCCGVYDEKWDFGNALTDGVFNVWNNAKYREARRAVIEKDTSNKDLICTYCIDNGFLEY